MAEQSLFGATPEALQASRANALQAQALQYAKLDPFQRATASIYQGAGQLGGAIGGMLGGQDPEMQRASMLKQLASQFDTTTAEGLTGFARAASQAGMPQQALQAAQQAQTMKLQGAQLSKVEEEALRLREANAREANLQADLAVLPSTATDAEVETVFRKYGKPEVVLNNLARKQQIAAQTEAKLTLEREKAEAKVAADAERARREQENIALKAQLASGLGGVQAQLVQEKLDALRDKKTEKAEKQEAAKAVAIRHATSVIKDVTDALPLVGNLTTGLIGKAASVVPGTPAFTLNQRVSTIKANLGFDRLQQMRDASPTGGALGQVAVQELQALQNSVASLEVGQDKDELIKNLGKIKEHYTKWLESTQGGPVTAPAANVPAAPAAAAGGWAITPKKP